MSENGKAPRSITKGEDLLGNYARTGSAADFEQIVRRFAPIVFSECRRVTRNPHDAEDAAQLTFLALAMELKVGKTINYPSAWLQRVAKHQAIKIVRSRGRRQKREDAVRREDLELPNEIALDAEHNSGVIRDEIDHLPDRYRLPLVLHYFGSMSLESIAGELKIGKQTVGTRLHRARKMLATKLSAHGIQLDAPVLATALSIVVPAAVVETIVRAATFPSPRPSFAFQATLTQMFHMTAMGAMKKWARGVAVASLVLACGSAIGNVTLPGWLKTPQLQGFKLIENLKQWISREIKPSIHAPSPLRVSSMSNDAQSAPLVVSSGHQASSTPLPVEMPCIEPPGLPLAALPVSTDLPTFSSLQFHSDLFLAAGSLYASWELSPFDPMNVIAAQAIVASPVPEPAAASMLVGALMLKRRRFAR